MDMVEIHGNKLMILKGTQKLLTSVGVSTWLINEIEQK